MPSDKFLIYQLKRNHLVRVKYSLPDLHQLILRQTTRTEDLDRSWSSDETVPIHVPCSEDLIIVFLLLLGKSPGYLGSPDFRVGEEGLELLSEWLSVWVVEVGSSRRVEGLKPISLPSI